jgi:mannose/cellobiose epimerase-like protein (N-acyl-D-glucosamine 2-epimerase family)
VYTGHAIETLWMLMDEALRRNDKPLLKRAVELFKRHLEVSWDDVYGGYFRCLTDVYENKWVLDKAGWLQEEAMIGLLTVIKHTDAKWAYPWFEKTLHYIENSVSLQKYGSALWNPWAQRQGGFNGDIKRIENYHHPRHLMLNILLMR